MARLLAASGPANVDLMRDSVISGLRGRELEFIERLLNHPAWSKPSTEHVETLATLARCVMAERRPSRVERLVTITAGEKEGSARQRGLIRGLASPEPAAGAAAARRARLIKLGRPAGEEPPPPKPIYLDERPAALDTLLACKQDEVATLAHELDARLAWPGKPGVPPPPVIKPLTSQEQAWFDKGKVVYTNVCSGCHQPTGVGQAGLAPPLADSEWVHGADGRLARIILHGLSGPVAVSGVRYNLEMPSLATLSDDDIAHALTYVRREWENTADPVPPDVVRQVRAETSTRTQAWTADELHKVR
jgi:mono/diheme cytochrome c family protein